MVVLVGRGEYGCSGHDGVGSTGRGQDWGVRAVRDEKTRMWGSVVSERCVKKQKVGWAGGDMLHPLICSNSYICTSGKLWLFI